MIAAPAVAQVLEPDALQRKQDEQQRARTLTRDLLAGVLDIQLRQLDENGLSDHEIYRDITSMRQHLNHLVETEMSTIVDLLAEAQQLPLEKRKVLFVEARQQVRAVVRQLSIERQQLLKRLKIVELTEQVRRLIRHQTIVQTTTKGLSAEQQTRREALTLKAIEDQRDVKELFLHLVDTMGDMRSWSGILATAATDGLRILKVAEVGPHLDRIGRHLQAVKLDLAGDEQALVIKGLNELLKVIERAQGTLNSDKLASIERVRALADQQKQLRDQTKELPDNQPPSAELVERQAQLQKEIIQLQDGIPDNPKAHSHIQQAETAAIEAATNLLDNKRSVAIAEQGRVLGNLTAIGHLLMDQARQQSRNKSADELAQTVRDLVATKAALVAARAKQEAAENTTERDRQSAASDTKDAADIVQQAIGAFEFPAVVEAVLQDAFKAAKALASSLDADPSEQQAVVQVKAFELAKRTLERAAVTVDAALMEHQRLESAVKIGELARAAEVLERIAAAERVIAKEATSCAEVDSSRKTEIAETAQHLSDRQAEVIAIADKMSQAIVQTAPDAAKPVDEGAKDANRSRTELLAVAGHTSLDTQSTLIQAASDALAASRQFTEAAKDIRQIIVLSAKELTERTASQADQLADVRAAVEEAIDQLPSDDKVAQLAAAKEKLGEAMQQQARAQGQSDAAVAMQLVRLIAIALETQDAANAVAASVQSGIGSELKAAIKQEEVVEKSQAAAEAAAKRKPDSLVPVLNEAKQAAAEAARQTLDGNQIAAEVSRHVTGAALNKALIMARQEASYAIEAPAKGRLDKQAQSGAAATTTDAQAMAAKSSADAAADIAAATAATQSAAEALSLSSEGTSATQEQAMTALLDADKKLDAAILQAAAEQAKGLAKQSNDHRTLADRVARVEPAAADAVNVAASEAKMGSEAGHSPRQMVAAANQAELSLEHAAADLGAKEQDVRRDQAIAESVANLVHDQQTATEVIAEQAATLESAVAEPDGDDDAAAAAAQRTAAKKLNDAQQQFADSQRATGQGAVELSGQKEVVNPPLREALELASNLPTNEFSSEMPADSDLPEDRSTTADDQPLADGQSVPSDQPATSNESSTEGKNQDENKRTGQPPPGAPGSSKPNGLGTGFIPQSPQLTAEMMAGSKAQQAAQKALGQQVSSSDQRSKDQMLPSDPSNDSEDGQPMESEHGNPSKLTKKDGSAAVNQKVKGGAIDKQAEGTEAAGMASNKNREKEEGVTARRLKEETWFARLPPELRKSIRAGAAQKPPRAYEERLKKYFQSVD